MNTTVEHVVTARRQPVRPDSPQRRPPAPGAAAAVLGLQAQIGNVAVARLLQRSSGDRTAAGSLVQRQPASGAEKDDGLYLASRRHSAGQSPSDRLTGTGLYNWALNRASMVMHSEDTLVRMQMADGIESTIVEEIYLLLIDILRGLPPKRQPRDSSHVVVGGGSERAPYPGGPDGGKQDELEGSDQAREVAVIELAERHWPGLSRYIEGRLSQIYNRAALDAFGRTPKGFELVTDTVEIADLRQVRHADVWKGGYAPLGGTNTWRVDDRVAKGTVAGISLKRSSAWIKLDGHPLWFYRTSLSVLGSQDTFVGTVAAGVFEQARFAGMLWPFMIKVGGFALSFSPNPLLILAGAALEELGEEGMRDLTGKGRSFEDMASDVAQQALIDIVFGKITGGGGAGGHAAGKAAAALERVAERSAAKVRDAVKAELVRSEGRHVVTGIDAGRASRVSDARLRGEGFIDEVKIRHEGGDHTWRRKRDGTWCRWSGRRLCDLDLPDASKLLAQKPTGRVTSDWDDKAGMSVLDVKRASGRADDQAEARMAELFDRDGYQVHLYGKGNDHLGDLSIDGVRADVKALGGPRFTSPLARGNKQAPRVILDGTQIRLTRVQTEAAIREWEAVIAKHPGQARNIERVYVVEGDGTIYVYLRKEAAPLRAPDPDKPTVRSGGG